MPGMDKIMVGSWGRGDYKDNLGCEWDGREII
jgi:hypothetical protein